LKNNQSLVFIVINILVAICGFVRSFAFMKFFNFKELGVITLVSTGAMLIGFFQIGLINGGYRIIALQDKESNEKVNNVVFSYFGTLSLFLIVFFVFTSITNLLADWLQIMLIIIIGISTLVTNWLTNALIGGREYKRLNIANSVSALASFACLLLAYYYGLIGALISLIIQPLLFVVMVFLTDRKEIPTAFDLDIKYIKYILSFGFIPFLSGIFFLLYQQIERWSVNSFLGAEALGKMYLVFLTTTLWLLIPTSINSLFFPKAVKFYADLDIIQFRKTIYKYLIILIIYCFVGIVLVAFLFSPLIELIFPKHLPYVKLVYIIVPALVLRTLSDPIGLLFNSMVILKPLLWSDIISTVFYGVMIFCLAYLKTFSLENVLGCYFLYNLIRLFYLLFHLKSIKVKCKI
jgi:O-antigen/teichoic acid export membrane protein